MIEENKFYIPQIEEFFVGFEGEILSSYGWQKGIWPKILQEDTLAGFEKDIIKSTKESTFRTKYLDKEDIEELGFKHLGETIFNIKGKNDVNYTLILYFHHEIGRLEIRCDSPSLYFGNFLGVIKNKSELRKLLKQLGIL